MKEFILTRLSETSTRITIITFLSGLIGVGLAPDQVEAISAAMVTILALVGVFTKEAK